MHLTGFNTLQRSDEISLESRGSYGCEWGGYEMPDRSEKILTLSRKRCLQES